MCTSWGAGTGSWGAGSELCPWGWAARPPRLMAQSWGAQPHPEPSRCRCRAGSTPMSGTRTTRRLWTSSTSSPPARPARRSSRCCGVGAGAGLTQQRAPSRWGWDLGGALGDPHPRAGYPVTLPSVPADASAALQVRAVKDYCNNYDLTSLNVKAGDVITVSAAVGPGGRPYPGVPSPCSDPELPAGAGAARGRALEGLHPRQPDRQRPRGLLPLQPRRGHKQANRQILPHLCLPRAAPKLVSPGTAQPWGPPFRSGIAWGLRGARCSRCGPFGAMSPWCM